MSNTTRKVAAKKSPAPQVIIGRDEFRYTSSAGVEIIMPSLAEAEITVEMMDDLADAMELVESDPFTAFRAQRRFMSALLNNPDIDAKLKKLTLPEFQSLIVAWGSGSGVTQGESSPS